MKSITLFTEEIDDMELAMEELTGRLKEKNFTLLANTCGIALCDSDVDMEELLAAFGETFDFPIMGCTALAMLTKSDGYQVSGISLLVLTADDCQFHMGMTAEFTDDTMADAIRGTYTELAKELPEKEKLILAYGTKDAIKGGDIYADVLSELSGNVPIYGALASDHFSFQDYQVFYGNRMENRGAIMLLITGNVKPVFHAEFSLDHLTTFSAKITSCEGNTIYTLDNKPFVKVLEEAGLKSKQANTDDVIMEFIGTPFLTVEEQENGEKVEKLRNLTRIVPDDGSGMFLGDIVQGATLHIGLMRKEDVQRSVGNAFAKVLHEMKEAGCEYSTLLCSSCGSRYLILATEPDAEAKAFRDVLPENVDLMGFYSFGEICPQVMESGHIYNCFHNDTFTILAI